MKPQDLERREEELEALQAIFGEDVHGVRGESGEIKTVRVSRKVPVLDRSVLIVFHLGKGYPSEEPPRVVVNSTWIDADVRVRISTEALAELEPSAGDVLLFTLSEIIYEACLTLAENIPVEEEKSARRDSSSDVEDIAEPEEIPAIYSGSPFTDRKSTFQAHLAEVHSEADLSAFLRALQSVNKIASATHNILAYRFVDETTGSLCQDFDDDGEAAAGKRLLHLLKMLPAENVAVVVSRWFGGIHLGPDRFKHINNAAREAFLEWKKLDDGEQKS
ncbi:hypothetical protein NDN08_004955 [Rhodosorus marinus]|uniref:RWD domain-containing protein n=1 Tax=Rhodosorus marinus TaxID=101924 RepID=A0AAV8UF48_9RHOD|nr:hypothetical protein NDN08_004955 [Rhodosorus marinus]